MNNSIEDKIQNAEMIILREFNNEADLYIIDEKDEENPYHLFDCSLVTRSRF